MPPSPSSTVVFTVPTDYMATAWYRQVLFRLVVEWYRDRGVRDARIGWLREQWYRDDYPLLFYMLHDLVLTLPGVDAGHSTWKQFACQCLALNFPPCRPVTVKLSPDRIARMARAVAVNSPGRGDKSPCRWGSVPWSYPLRSMGVCVPLAP